MDKHGQRMIKPALIDGIAEDIFWITKIIYKLNQLNVPIFSSENSIPEEYVVILDILKQSDNELSMGEIASHSGISPSSLSKIIKIMEEDKGFVKRSFAPNDRRQTILRIAPKGEKALSMFREGIIRRMGEILSEIDEEKLPEMAEAANLFKTALEKVDKKYKKL